MSSVVSFLLFYTRGVYNAFAAMKKDAERKKEGGGRGSKVKVDNLNANHTFVPPHVTCHERTRRIVVEGDVTLHNRKKKNNIKSFFL